MPGCNLTWHFSLGVHSGISMMLKSNGYSIIFYTAVEITVKQLPDVATRGKHKTRKWLSASSRSKKHLQIKCHSCWTHFFPTMFKMVNSCVMDDGSILCFKIYNVTLSCFARPREYIFFHQQKSCCVWVKIRDLSWRILPQNKLFRYWNCKKYS